MIGVNLVAGSGAHGGKGSWIFSGMARRIVEFADPDEFEIVVTPEPDMSRSYDLRHYLHSTLAVQHGHDLHRSLVTVVALDDIAPHRTFASKRDALQRCRRVSTICRDVRNSLIYQGVPEGKVEYTPMGVDLDAFAPTGEDREGVILRHGGVAGTGDIIRIGLIGRSYPDGRKGEGFLSQVLWELLQRHEYQLPVCMVFIGGWNGKDIVANASYLGGNPIQVEEHIIDSDCTYEDYPDLYETLDGVVVTSKTEAGPACILEALAKGLPVVSTPGGMANEFLTRRNWETREKIGAVIPYEDTHGFADAIEELIMGDRRSLDVRKRVSQILVDPSVAPSMRPGDTFPDEYPYSWENWSARFQRIYREMASDVKGKRFFQDFIPEGEMKKIDETFKERADSSLPDLYLENFLNTMEYSRRGIGLREFGGILQDLPSVVVGIGPSLNEHVKLLAENQDRIVIIACDAAIPVLTKNGIIPHVVVAADPTDRQIKNFAGIDCSGFLTVMPTVIHPLVFHESRKSDCKVAWYNLIRDGSLICRMIPKVIGQKGGLAPIVLTTGMAMQTAMFMGSWPITFIGHDLGWYDINGDGYADGVPEEKIVFQKGNKMMGGDTMNIPDVNGRMLTTEINFFMFVHWANRYLEDMDMRVYNSTGCGLLYGDRIVQMPFDEWVSRFAKPHDAPARLLGMYEYVRQQIDRQCLPSYTEEVLKEINLLDM